MKNTPRQAESQTCHAENTPCHAVKQTHPASNPPRHANIPIFIPHLGCPNDCVFCNQRAISGRTAFDISSVRRDIDIALATIGGRDAEIAFFGGSFTGIDRALMTALLDIAAEYVSAGAVRSIRLSTRPDYIDSEIISILRSYPVSDIELGIQSMSDGVLRESRRGHCAADSERACALVLRGGFNLVGQMMVGLPGSSREDEIYTAQRICDMGASGARIYPTVVLRDTALCDMAARGEYTPLSISKGAERASWPLEVFSRRGVKVLRIGLCATDSMSGGEDVVGGAYHPALGELAANELYLRLIRRELDAVSREATPSGASLTIQCAAGELSKVSGQKKRVKTALMREYNVKKVKVIENSALCEYNISITLM